MNVNNTDITILANKIQLHTKLAGEIAQTEKQLAKRKAALETLSDEIDGRKVAIGTGQAYVAPAAAAPETKPAPTPEPVFANKV